MVTPRALTVFASVGIVVACTSSAPAPNESPSAPDAGVVDAPAESSIDGPRSLLPYPSGPYGSAVGEVLEDFHVIGYALSREQRDISSLPFRDIKLSEVRSDPSCACLVIIWSTAGLTCFPSIEGRNTVAAELTRVPSLCAVDVIWDTLDSGPPQVVGDSFKPDPATRADLEDVCHGLRPPFPVGLATEDAVKSLGTNPIPGLPDFYIVRTSDMRVADYVYGSIDLPKRIEHACGSPRPGVETLATGFAPTALLLDDTHAFIADAEKHILRIPRNGGAAQTVVDLPANAGVLANDATNVYWTEPTALARAPKVGGARTELAVVSSPVTSMAIHTGQLFLGHSDGTIGSVPAPGGPETILLTGEAAPRSILVDEARLYWLTSAGEVAKAAKDGSERTTVLAASSRKRAQISFAEDRIVVREQENYLDRNTFVWMNKDGSGVTTDDGDYGLNIAGSWDPVAKCFDLVLRGGDRSRGNDALLDNVAVTKNPDGRRIVNHTTLGQRDVTAVASGGDGYVYWTTNEATGGALKRVKR